MRRVPLSLFGLLSVAALAFGVLAFHPQPASLRAAERAPFAQPAADAADLAMVPADAVGFVHVRLAELWKDEMFSGFRKTWEAAGPKALAAIDTQFTPAPSSVSRATAFLVLDAQAGEPMPFLVLTFSAPFSPDEVVKANLPDAKSAPVAGKSVYASPKYPGAAVTFPDDRHILIGTESGLKSYLSKPVAKDGPLAGALKLAATRPMIAAANIAALPIPPDALDQVPAEIRPILKAKLVVLSLDLGRGANIELRATYADEAAAKDAEAATRALIALGRKELAKLKTDIENDLHNPKRKGPKSFEDLPEAIGMVFAIGALNRLDGYLADPQLITRQGADLSASLPVPKEIITAAGTYVAALAAVLLPAVAKVRDAAARAKSTNNLKQIGLAIHNYHDATNQFPRDITDKAGKPLLSWRVAILPYIEQNALFRSFKMDEPWDGPNNARLSKTLVATYLSPNTDKQFNADGYALTSYKGVSGPDAMFQPGAAINFARVPDGLSNTAMVLEAGDPIPWAKPGDYEFDPKKPLPPLAAPGMGDLTTVLMGDGSVRVMNTKTVSEKTFKALFTRSGGEVIDFDR